MTLASAIATLPLALFTGLLGLAVLTDLQEYRIPNAVTLAIAALFPVQALVPGAVPNPLGSVILGAVVLAVGTGLFALRALGGGDVKLIAAVSLWIGPQAFPDFLLITALTGGLMAVFHMTQYRIGLAAYLESWGETTFTRSLTGVDLPYAVAIAAGTLAALSAQTAG